MALRAGWIATPTHLARRFSGCLFERPVACCTDERDGIGRGLFRPFGSRLHAASIQCRPSHHIPRPKRRVTNWAAYNEALRQRGSLTVWFTEDAIAAWKAAPRTTPGGQPHYSDLAITTALTLRAVFHLPLRQTKGLIGSVLQLLGLDLPVPEPVRASAATSPPSEAVR